MGEPQHFDPELGLMVAVPEPFWVRSLRTLFRWRPACYPCRKRFGSQALWEQHWLSVHYDAMPPEGETRGETGDR